MKSMTNLKYMVTLEKNELGGYTVTVPALPGCVTQGKTVSQALKRAKQAVEGHVLALKKVGKAIPVPAAVEISVSV